MLLVLVEHGTMVGAAPKTSMGDNFYLDFLRTTQRRFSPCLNVCTHATTIVVALGQA